MTAPEDPRKVELGFGAAAYINLGMAGMFGLLPFMSGVVPIVGFLGGFDSRSGSPMSPIASTVIGVLASVVTVVAPWLVPCLVLRARQPKGARIEWDSREIALWDGPWKRTVIRWDDAEAARYVWDVPTRYGHHLRTAIEVFDKTNPEAVISAWDEQPEEAPLARRRREVSKIYPLDSIVGQRCDGFARDFEMARVADPDRPVQTKLVRNLTRLGYVAAFVGPLMAGPSTAFGIAVSAVGSALLAWRAAPVFSELANVRSKLAQRPAEMPAHADPYREAAPAPRERDPNELLAWRYRLRAVIAEAFVRGALAVLPLCGALASAGIKPN